EGDARLGAGGGELLEKLRGREGAGGVARVRQHNQVDLTDPLQERVARRDPPRVAPPDDPLDRAPKRLERGRVLAERRMDDEVPPHKALPARKPRPSGRGGAPITVIDCPQLELSTRSASGPGDNQAVGPLRQPSKRRWCWTGRLPRSQAGRRTVNLEPQGQALGLKHGLLSLKAPDFSPGDVYTLPADAFSRRSTSFRPMPRAGPADRHPERRQG